MRLEFFFTYRENDNTSAFQCKSFSCCSMIFNILEPQGSHVTTFAENNDVAKSKRETNAALSLSFSNDLLNMAGIYICIIESLDETLSYDDCHMKFVFPTFLIR